MFYWDWFDKAQLAAENARVLEACKRRGFRIWKSGAAWCLAGLGEYAMATEPAFFRDYAQKFRR